MSADMQSIRAKIDALDDEILKLINRRAGLAQQAGQLKADIAYRPEREAQVLRRARENNPGPLSGDAVAFLFREIMSSCLALEKPVAVSYLGPQGTFSEAAATKHFGHAAQAMACGSIDEVFRKAESGSVDFAVVPIENSTEGAVGKTLDSIVQTPLKACGEVLLRIHQHLLAKTADLPLHAIKRVFSHPQSFSQCHQWLAANLPQAERIPAPSNAEAARLAALESDAAAIAGEASEGRYGLKRLAQNIEDEPTNTTRFLVLGAEDAPASGRDKTSLVMAVKNRPGAIHHLLEPLAQYGVSMSKLESRPSRLGNWEYFFFTDIDGHREDDKVAPALGEIDRRASFFKILGSYPVAAL